jgi:hypothetical protein
MDSSDKWFTLDNRGGPIWGSRGREFKSRQPDIKVPSKTGFRSRLRRSNRLNVATGVATGILTTSPPESLPEPLGGFALLVHCHMAVDVCGDPVGVPSISRTTLM